VKRWTKIVLVFVVLIVAALGSIPLFVNANTFRPGIENQLTTALGRAVKVGDLHVSFFSGGLVAKDLSIADDPNFSAAPFLTAKEVRIGVELRSLIFARQINMRSLQVESPQIALIRAANGEWNFSSIRRRIASGDTGAGIPKASEAELSSLSVDRIVIDEGRAVVSLPAHVTPLAYEHVNLTAHAFSLASRFPFDLNVALPPRGIVSVSGHVGPIDRYDSANSPADAQISAKNLDPATLGFLDPDGGLSFLAAIDMHAATDGQTLTTSGTIHIQDLKLRKDATALRPLDFSYRGTHRLKGNSGQIEEATATMGHAVLHLTGAYQPRLLNLKLAGQRLPIDEIQPVMTAAAIRLPDNSVLKGGTLSMNFSITGHTDSLVIIGPLKLDDTRLVGFDVSSHIHGIAALSGLKKGDTTNFDRLYVNVRVANAGVLVDDIDAVIPEMGELTGSGTVSPAHQLDFNLVAKVASAKGIGKVGVVLLTKLNGSDGSSRNASGVPMHVTGTPDDPYITTDVGGIVHKKMKSIASTFSKKP
jgi:AsmA protein